MCHLYPYNNVKLLRNFFYINFLYKNAAARRDASFYVTTMKQMVYCCDGARDLYGVLPETERRTDTRIYWTQISARSRIGQCTERFLLPSMLPFFRSHGKKILANAVKTTAQVADDVLRGKTVN